MVEQVKTKTEPYVRFRGFDDEWEEVKLGDVRDVRDGTHDSPTYQSEGLPLVTSKNLTDSGLNMDNVSLISKNDYDLINKRSNVDVGDILFGMIGTIGNPVIVDRDDFAIKNVALVKSEQDKSDVFLLSLLKSSIFTKYILIETAGNTQKFLSLNKIRNFKYLTPSLDEQQKIGELFQTLDKTINLSNTQAENLKQQKKALLQRLFPQKGETAPKVRLRGFTDEWNEVKLGDVLVKSDERSNENNQYPVMTSSRQGLFLQSDYFSHQVASKDNTGYRVIRKGEFTYRSMSDDNVFVFNQLRQHTVGIVSPAYVVFGLDGADGYYLNEYLNSSAFRRTMVKMIQGGTRTSYKYKSLIDTKVQLPSLDEQQAIGELFQTFDEQIRLAEDKVSQYKELKQALLQRLFV